MFHILHHSVNIFLLGLLNSNKSMRHQEQEQEADENECFRHGRYRQFLKEGQTVSFSCRLNESSQQIPQNASQLGIQNYKWIDRCLNRFAIQWEHRNCSLQTIHLASTVAEVRQSIVNRCVTKSVQKLMLFPILLQTRDFHGLKLARTRFHYLVISKMLFKRTVSYRSVEGCNAPAISAEKYSKLLTLWVVRISQVSTLRYHLQGNCCVTVLVFWFHQTSTVLLIALLLV